MNSLFNFQVSHTSISVVTGDITRLPSDALVSSDDVYLSMSGGVSLAINRTAGDNLFAEVRKQNLPLSLGSVVVTSAGKLPARYIFHAATVDFKNRPPVDALIACLMRRILELATVLQVDHIVLPLLGAGTAGLPKEQVLEYMLQSTMYHLVSQNFSVQRLSVAMWDTANVMSTLEKLREKVNKAADIQTRIDHIQQLRNETPHDVELHSILDSRIASSIKSLRDMFYFTAIDTDINPNGKITLNYDQYQKAKKQLEEAVERLQDEIEVNKKLQQIQKRRLSSLEKKQAIKGISTDPEIEMEIEDIKKLYDQRKRQIEQMVETLHLYQKELGSLRYA